MVDSVRMGGHSTHSAHYGSDPDLAREPHDTNRGSYAKMYFLDRTAKVKTITPTASQGRETDLIVEEAMLSVGSQSKIDHLGSYASVGLH